MREWCTSAPTAGSTSPAPLRPRRDAGRAVIESAATFTFERRQAGGSANIKVDKRMLVSLKIARSSFCEIGVLDAVLDDAAFKAEHALARLVAQGFQKRGVKASSRVTDDLGAACY